MLGIIQFNMKRIFLYILPLLLLTSCGEDNWFSHRIEYNDVIEPQQMVLTSFLKVGKYPFIDVNHSWFFLDPNSTKHEADEYYYSGINVGYLTDAVVTLTVNGSKVYNLHYDVVNRCYLTFDYTVTEGDQLLVTATHPDYGTVTATEHVPYAIPFTVDHLAEDGYNATFDLHLQPYHYTEGDVLCLRAKTFVRQEYYTYDQELLGYRDTTFFYHGEILTYEIPIYGDYHDTCYIGQQQIDCIYGRHVELAFFETNKSMSQGYYGADGRRGLGLCLPASAVGDGLTIPMATYITYKPREDYVYDYDDYYDRSPYRDSIAFSLDSIQVDVIVLSEQEAMCRLANEKLYGSYYIPSYPQGETTVVDGDEFVDMIEDIFETMGNMEGYQVYDNVDGGIGHVTASAIQSVILKK